MIHVIEVSGESCANCFTLMPILKELCEKMGLPLTHIEANEKTAERVQALRIERVPTVIVMQGEKEIARCTGFQPYEILEVWLSAMIEKANTASGEE